LLNGYVHEGVLCQDPYQSSKDHTGEHQLQMSKDLGSEIDVRAERQFSPTIQQDDTSFAPIE
jgi:hypothetical protein